MSPSSPLQKGSWVLSGPSPLTSHFASPPLSGIFHVGFCYSSPPPSCFLVLSQTFPSLPQSSSLTNVPLYPFLAFPTRISPCTHPFLCWLVAHNPPIPFSHLEAARFSPRVLIRRDPPSPLLPSFPQVSPYLTILKIPPFSSSLQVDSQRLRP